MIIYDTETYSQAPINKGLEGYFAASSGFRLLCLAFGEDPNHVQVMHEVPEALRTEQDLWSHNARFDSKATGLNHTQCTKTQAAVNGAPSRLEHLCKFLNTPHKKNPDGKRLINLCCVPGGNPTPEDFRKLEAYCADDVRATLAAVTKLRELTPKEKRQYEVSEIINNRGMKLDRELAEAAVKLRREEEQALDLQVQRLTGLKAKSIKMLPYLMGRLPERYHTVFWDSDKNRLSLDSSVREALLEDETLPYDVRELVELIEAARSTSGSKYARALEFIDYPGSDDILRGAYVFSGARVTGRFSSQGVQMHNLPRPEEGFDPEAARSTIVSGRSYGDTLLKTLRSLLRSMVIPREGSTLMWGDSAQIEARVIQWLASPTIDTPILAAFRRGDDPYQICADSIGSTRKVGKVAILACGFQGGVNALGRMCKAYGVTLTEGQMQNVVTRWRETNQAVVQFWGNLDRAAVMAVTRRKSVQQVGLIAFYCVEDRLLVRLPSGRMLTYWHPDLVENQYGEYVVEVDNVSLLPPAAGGPWPRKQMYGGLWAENVTQATAADVLREALVRCEDDGLLTVGHTHDEIITETTNVERDSKLLERALTDPFEWSGRLPLGCDIQTGARYRK